MKAFVILGAAMSAAIASGSMAANEADPALAVCEIAIKKSLKAPKSYERSSFSIVGHQVFVTYDAVNEYNAPLRNSQVCEFFMDQGKVALVPLDLRRLIRVASDIKQRTGSIANTSDAKRLEKDAIAAQVSMTATMVRHAAVSLEAAKATEYPIPPANTEIVPLDKLPSLPE